MRYLMLRRLFVLFLVLFTTVFVHGCAATESVENERVAHATPQQILSRVIAGGLTCEVQRSILALSVSEREDLARLIRGASLTNEQRWAMADTRERNCSTSNSFRDQQREEGVGEFGTSVQAITGTYSVVFIPEGTTSGNYANSVFYDSASSGWMCNSGSPESPADFVVQFHLQGAYYSRNQLELQGQNWWGSCYLGSTTASRVYSDDDVRSCIGYWTVVVCGGTPPLTTDIVLGL